MWTVANKNEIWERRKDLPLEGIRLQLREIQGITRRDLPYLNGKGGYWIGSRNVPKFPMICVTKVRIWSGEGRETTSFTSCRLWWRIGIVLATIVCCVNWERGRYVRKPTRSVYLYDFVVADGGVLTNTWLWTRADGGEEAWKDAKAFDWGDVPYIWCERTGWPRGEIAWLGWCMSSGFDRPSKTWKRSPCCWTGSVCWYWSIYLAKSKDKVDTSLRLDGDNAESVWILAFRGHCSLRLSWRYQLLLWWFWGSRLACRRLRRSCCWSWSGCDYSLRWLSRCWCSNLLTRSRGRVLQW